MGFPSITSTMYFMDEKYFHWIGEQVFLTGKANKRKKASTQYLYFPCSGLVHFILKGLTYISIIPLRGLRLSQKSGSITLKPVKNLRFRTLWEWVFIPAKNDR